MSAQERFAVTERTPLPPGGRLVTVPVGGAELRAAFWQPGEGGVPRGTVLLFNGRTEFIEKYCEVIGELIDRGFAVATLDWRGQGLSSRAQADRNKGHVNDFTEYDEDVRAFVDAVVLPNCPKPYFLLAHSMGGNIALRYLASRECIVERAILVAPMTGVHTHPFPKWAAHLVAGAGRLLRLGNRYVPGGAGIDPLAEKFEENGVTSDTARFGRYKELIETTPDLALGAPTLGWLSAAFRTMKEAASPEHLRAIGCPVLILSAAADTIADSATHAGVAADIPQGELLSVAGAKHEILMERDDIRAQFWQAFDRFIGPAEATEVPSQAV